MQSFAESLSHGGAYAYLALLFGLAATPLGITGLIVALVSKRRKPGFLLGIITLGLCALSFLVALVGNIIGMFEARAAVESAPPQMLSSIGTSAVSYSVGPMKIALMLIGLPFVLSVLTLSRAAVRPDPNESKDYVSDSRKRTANTGRAGGILGAILPGVFTLFGFFAFAIQGGGIQHLAMSLSDSGGFGLLTVFWAVIAAVLLSILGPKAARGKRILVAPLLLLACLPWLVGVLATLSAGSDSLSALEWSAPDQRAAVIAMGIAISLTTHTLGALISTWLLFALGLTLAIGAKGQRAANPLGGRGLLFGAAATAPILILAVVAVLGETFFALVVLSALFALVITMLGASGMGTDGPYHRSVSLGIGAAAAGCLAFLAACHGAAGGFIVNAFSALEMAAPDQRMAAMGSAAAIMGRFLIIRDYGWIVALVPLGVLAAVASGRAPLEKGRLAGALFTLGIFILTPVLYMMSGSMLRTPDWAASKSPWAIDPQFAPSIVTPTGCRDTEGGADPAAVVGVSQVYMGGMAYGDPAQPTTASKMVERFQHLRQMAVRIGSMDETTYDIAVDDRLPVATLNNVLGAVRTAGLERVRLIGTEMPQGGSMLQSNGDPADMHPLLGTFTQAMASQVCGISIDLGSHVRNAAQERTWIGIVGMTETMPVSRFGAGNPGTAIPPAIGIPSRDRMSIREMMHGAARPYQPSKGNILLLADASMLNLTTGRMILAAAAAETQGYRVSLPDPSSVKSSASKAAPVHPGLSPQLTGQESGSQVRIGPLVVKGSISKEEVQRVIRANTADLNNCREIASKSNQNHLGQISVKFIISGRGDVHSAALSSSTIKNSTMESCITEAHREWGFPGPRGGGIAIVTAQYVFL